MMKKEYVHNIMDSGILRESLSWTCWNSCKTLLTT